MAKILLSAPVAGIRGTIGGITYSQNATGPYAKGWSRSSNPRTPRQTRVRGPFGSQGPPWRALTPAQRAAWATWAALPAQERTDVFGNPYYLSGWQWFVLLNTRLRLAGLPPLTDEPADPRPTAPTLSGITWSESSPLTAEVTYPAATFDPDFTLVLETTLQPYPSATVPRYRPVQILVETSPDNAAQTFGAEFRNRLGLPVEGQAIYAALYRQSVEGLRSQPDTAQAAVTA